MKKVSGLVSNWASDKTIPPLFTMVKICRKYASVQGFMCVKWFHRRQVLYIVWLKYVKYLRLKLEIIWENKKSEVIYNMYRGPDKFREY